MMQMSLRQVTLSLLVSLSTILVSDGAKTSTSCPEVACFGRPVNVTCDITGQFDSIGFSRPDTIEVVSCQKSTGKCYENTEGYKVVVRTDDKHIMLIESLKKIDVGAWNCRDLTNPLLKTCHIQGYDVRQSPTSAPPDPGPDSCIHITKTFRPQTLCKDFQEDPDNNITIKVAGSSYSFTYDQYKQNDEVKVADIPTSGELECKVTGPGAQCYTASKQNSTKICGSSAFPTWAIIIIILLILIIFGCLVDCVYCRPRDKGATHFLRAKLMSRNADVTTKSEKKPQNTGEATAETDSPAEGRPLLDEKTAHVNSNMTVENETKKTTELEPEDKDGAATEHKSEDKPADATGDKSPGKTADAAGDKSPDKTADATGDKSPDKEPAVLVVQSEKKEAK